MFQKLEEGIKAVAAKATADLAKLKAYADGKFLGIMRLLTSEDDCNNIKEDGVYWYSTASVPKNAPFANAAIIEVYGAGNNTSQKIQRGTRYGAGGYSATRALFSGNWSEWYHYTLTTDGIVPVSGGGTGGKTIAEAQAALHLTQNYLYSQLDSSGNTSLSGIDAYPTRPGVFRITGNGTDFGMPTNYGCLVIFNGGSYYMHLYVNSQGFWVANTNSMTAPTWKRMSEVYNLAVGTEYATTERWNGSVVYAQLLEGFTLPNSTSTTVTISGATGIKSIDGYITNGKYDIPIWAANAAISNMYFTKSSGELNITTNADRSTWTCYLTVKYIK